MLEALIAGESDPDQLAELARGRLRAKLGDLRLAMAGRFGEHHRVMLRVQLDHIDHLDAAIAALDERVDEVMALLSSCGSCWTRSRGAANALVSVPRRRVELVSPGGLLAGLTKQVLEASLEVEMDASKVCPGDRGDLVAGDHSRRVCCI
jgi:hypothetical protein